MDGVAEFVRRTALGWYLVIAFAFTWSLLRSGLEYACGGGRVDPMPLLFMPGMPQFGVPIAAFAIYTVALSVILTFLARKTRGSVLIATLFHGAVNTSGWVNPAADPALRTWSNALCYGLAAVLLGASAWGGRLRQQGGPT